MPAYVTAKNASARLPADQAWLWHALAVLVSTLAVVLTIGWIVGAARIAADRLPERRNPMRLIIWAAACFVLCWIAGPAYYSLREMLRPNALIIVLGLGQNVSAIALVWRASEMIKSAEAHAAVDKPGFDPFFPLLLLFIGVWWMRPRVLKLSTPPTRQAQA
jgi:hypothetical protein